MTFNVTQSQYFLNTWESRRHVLKLYNVCRWIKKVTIVSNVVFQVCDKKYEKRKTPAAVFRLDERCSYTLPCEENAYIFVQLW